MLAPEELEIKDEEIIPDSPLEEKQEKQTPIIIALFNQKGGVGKTTATYCLGETLIRLGLSVLMVDADPQSSLTANIHPKHSSDKTKNQEFEQKLQDAYKKNRYSRMDHIFEPAMGVRKQDVVTIDRAKHVRILPVHKYKGLFYLPGSIKLERLNSAITLGIGNVSTAYSFVNMVPNVIKEIGRLNDIDIVLVDINPSIGGLNQSLLMNSDYIFMPFKPSIGCLDSVKNLVEEVPYWFEQFRKSEFLAKDEGPLLLGTFPQIMRTRKQRITDPQSGEKKIKEGLEIAFEKWIIDIFSKTEELLDIFLKHMPGIQQKIPFRQYRDKLGVPDMVGAGLQVQDSGHPMSDIDFDHRGVKRNKKTNEIVRGGKFRDTWKDKKEQTHYAYRKIIGTYFQFLTEAHKQKLEARIPGIMKTLNLYSSLSDELVREQAIASWASQSRSNKRKHSTRWYSDAHITQLLKNITQKSPGFYYTTPMQGDGKQSEETLTNNIKGYLLEHIASEYHDTGMTIFIPLNIGALPGAENQGGNHWTLVVARVNQGGLSELFYFDPFGNDITLTANTAILKATNEVFHKDIKKIQKLQGVGQVQFDAFNCGPWIIKAASILALGGNLATLQEVDIAAERSEFDNILKLEGGSARKKKRRKKDEVDSEPVVNEASFSEEHSAGEQVSAPKLSRIMFKMPDHKKEIQEILAALPVTVKKAFGEGDCFYDAIGQGLERNHIALPKKMKQFDSYKALRMLCRQYAIDNKKQSRWKKSWLAKALKKEGNDYAQYIIDVQFTAAEKKVEYDNKTAVSDIAVWGRPNIEGRILCQELKIRIHVLEFQIVEGSLIPIHQIYDGAGGSKTVEPESIDYHDKTLLHIAVHQSHFVPMIKPIPSSPRFFASNSPRALRRLELEESKEAGARV